jgi:hypothetical protein
MMSKSNSDSSGISIDINTPNEGISPIDTAIGLPPCAATPPLPLVRGGGLLRKDNNNYLA